ncbi:ATP-binding cassette domain-containing protein [[Acholeplasma] multilocale]|uniref:ATP-binding cassette domain-containing protein n=1 Tax=[Acholeplasma] multilocale TaxID=264638 RepID=UPI00047C6CFE|nr:ABC transporter ATP-binding protein [[Acholeplasma] multilocale]
MNEFLSVKNLSKEFHNGTGIEDVNFIICPGEIVGLLGDNGVGKTTVIKLIFDEFLKDEGEIRIDGEILCGRKSLANIAFFPDHNEFPQNMNIIEYAKYAAKLKGVENDLIDELSLELLDSLNLSANINNSYSELSAGMQKRAMLYAVLITQPDIIFFDEPTSNMDVKSRMEFLNLILFLSSEYKKTIVITSHNIDELSTIITRVIILDKKKQQRTCCLRYQLWQN